VCVCGGGLGHTHTHTHAQPHTQPPNVTQVNTVQLVSSSLTPDEGAADTCTCTARYAASVEGTKDEPEPEQVGWLAGREQAPCAVVLCARWMAACC
jgi:hypothetical protein